MSRKLNAKSMISIIMVLSMLFISAITLVNAKIDKTNIDDSTPLFNVRTAKVTEEKLTFVTNYLNQNAGTTNTVDEALAAYLKQYCNDKQLLQQLLQKHRDTFQELFDYAKYYIAEHGSIDANFKLSDNLQEELSAIMQDELIMSESEPTGFTWEGTCGSSCGGTCSGSTCQGTCQGSNTCGDTCNHPETWETTCTCQTFCGTCPSDYTCSGYTCQATSCQVTCQGTCNTCPGMNTCNWPCAGGMIVVQENASQVQVDYNYYVDPSNGMGYEIES